MPNYGVGVDDEGNDVIVDPSEQAVPEEAPFQVGEEIEVDLESVQQQLMPAAKNIHGRIRNASTQVSADQTLRSLKLEIDLPDGILSENVETGEQEAQYVGKVIFPGFMDLCYWASNDATPELLDRLKVEARPDKKGWFKAKQHLLGFKEFMQALGEPLKQKIGDAFCEKIIGRDILFSIKHEADTQKDATGKRVKTGQMRETYGQWKKYVDPTL